MNDAALEIRRIRETYGRRAALGRRYADDVAAVRLERRGLVRAVRRALVEHGFGDPARLRVLDVGGGDGSFLARLFAPDGPPARMCTVDLLPERLRAGRRRCPDRNLVLADGRRLPFPANAFDLTVQCTVLSSVLGDVDRRAIAAEMERVTRPGGLVLWYDMRVTRIGNRDVRPVGPREAGAWHPEARVTSRPITLFPPLARPLAAAAWPLAAALSAVPALCGHRLTAIRLPDRGGRTP